MNIPTTTTKGEQAKSQLIAAAGTGAVWRVWPPCHHARYRRAGGAKILPPLLLFRLKRGFIPPAPSGLPGFSWRKFRPMLKRNVCLASLPLTDAIRELILPRLQEHDYAADAEDTVNLEQIYFTRAALSPRRPINWSMNRLSIRCTPI